MSNDGTRAELLEAIEEVGRVHPTWRLGQLLANLAMAAGHLDAGAVWDLEDHEALAAARQLLGYDLADSAAGVSHTGSPVNLP